VKKIVVYSNGEDWEELTDENDVFICNVTDEQLQQLESGNSPNDLELTETDLELKDRIYHCQHCGLTMDRDHNAARNILKLGTSCVKTEAPAFRQE